jgi:molybdopterin converting factor small subunit
MDIFGQLTEKIIKEQEELIGPIALEQAQKVPGLFVDMQKHEITFTGNKTDIVEKLVEKYKELFGQASVEVCKDAVRSILSKVPKEQVPALLQ